MAAALSDLRERDLSKVFPDWPGITVEEFPSNSHFERIIRDVPSEISDKEWWDCLTTYTAVRTVCRLPDRRLSFCDMFIALEDQSSEIIFAALLNTSHKYGSSLVDIVQRRFKPPPSFLTQSASSKEPIKSESKYSYHMRESRFTRFEDELAFGGLDSIASSDVAFLGENRLCKSPPPFYNPSVRTPGIIHVNLYPASKEPLPTAPAANLTRPCRSVSRDRKTEKVEQPERCRQDPSDIWFSCGEEPSSSPTKNENMNLSGKSNLDALEAPEAGPIQPGVSERTDETAGAPKAGRSECSSWWFRRALRLEIYHRTNTTMKFRRTCHKARWRPRAKKSKRKHRFFESDESDSHDNLVPNQVESGPALHLSNVEELRPELLPFSLTRRSKSYHGVSEVTFSTSSALDRNVGSPQSNSGSTSPKPDAPNTDYYEKAKLENRLRRLTFCFQSSDEKPQGKLPVDEVLSPSEQEYEDRLIAKWRAAYKIYENNAKKASLHADKKRRSLRTVAERLVPLRTLASVAV